MNTPNRTTRRRWLFVLLDLALTQGALLLAQELRFIIPLGLPIEPDTVYLSPLVCVVVASIWLTVFAVTGVYERRKLTEADLGWPRVALSITFALFALASGLYFLKIQDFSRLLFLYFYLLDLAVLIGWRVMASRLGLGKQDARRVLVVGGDGLGYFLASQVASWPGYELVGTVANDPEPGPSTLPRLGSLTDAAAVVTEQHVDEVLVVPGTVDRDTLAELVMDLRGRSARVYIVPDLLEILTSGGTVAGVEGVPLVSVRASEITGLDGPVKRGMDVVGACILLLVTAPLFPLIALVIKLDSPGPVFFAQERAGKNGTPFEVYKFRTMVVGAEEQLSELVDLDSLPEPAFKIADDPRVTRVGRWLRRTSLDEIPQFVNVLRGEMSLVGPRPEEVQLVQRYDPWQRRRLVAKPGVTGAMQVSGRGDLPLAERVKLELAYIEHYSLWNDILILLRTIPAVIRGTGSH